MVYAVLATRWWLAVVLAAAAVAKLGDRAELEATIRRYRALPAWLVSPMAWCLPRGEFVLAVSLGAGILPGIGAAITCVAFCGFAGLIGRSLRRGEKFDCGCGSVAARPIGWRLVAADLAFAVIAAVVALAPAPALSMLTGFAGSASPSAVQLIPVPLLVVLVGAAVRLSHASTPTLTAALARAREGASRPHGDATGRPSATLLTVISPNSRVPPPASSS
jgi:hypothetical protein